MFEFKESVDDEAYIKVIAVGGGGIDAQNHMIANLDTTNWRVAVMHYIALDTDASALSNARATTTLLLGSALCDGLGTGGHPEMGERAALAERESIRALLTGADMVFIVACLGGGTGGGVAPVIASVAQEMGTNLTVGVVTLPGAVEGEPFTRHAQSAAKALTAHVDSLIAIPTDNLDMAQTDSHERQHNLILNAVRHPIEMFADQLMMSVDFADVRVVMRQTGVARQGMGYATGCNRVEQATMLALSHPMLKDVDLSSSVGALIQLSANVDFTFEEFAIIHEIMKTRLAVNTTMVAWIKIDPELEGVIVTVLVTGVTLV